MTTYSITLRNKFLCTHTSTFDEFIEALEQHVAYLKEMREAGVELTGWNRGRTTQPSSHPIQKLPRRLGWSWNQRKTKQKQCTRPELDRWEQDGRLTPDGLVNSYRWATMNRTRQCMSVGWLPETIERAKPQVEQWRADDELRRKSEQKQKARVRRQVKKLMAV
jgi:hypothetical protein